MNRGNPKDKGAAGRKAEGSIAKRLKGELRPGSGSLEGAKGDLLLDSPTFSFLMENKTTLGESFSMKKDWLLKIYQEALETNKTPALSFQFVDTLGKSEKRERWVAVPEHIFSQLTGLDL